MTSLIAETASRDAVHILIIGVGRYDASSLAPLPGAAKSAECLAEFWRTAPLAGGRKMGSIEVLISHSKPVPMVIANGTVQDVQAATKEAVRASIKAWAARCAAGALGILHWIGHGETVSLTDEAGTSREPMHVLYTEDLDHEFGGAPIPAGFKWDDTYRALQRLLDIPVLCFIDACSNVGSGSRGYSSPWQIQHGEMKGKADILLAVQPGEKAHCAWEKRRIGKDFECGALFSQAVLLGLSKFGADDHDGREGYAVFLRGLLDAVNARLERWSRSDKDLRDLRMPDLLQSSFRGPIVRMPKPFGMIDVMSPAGTRDFDCYVTDPAKTVHKLLPGTERWEADFPHGTGYDARLDKKAGWARGPVSSINKPFPVDWPHRIVEVT